MGGVFLHGHRVGRSSGIFTRTARESERDEGVDASMHLGRGMVALFSAA